MDGPWLDALDVSHRHVGLRRLARTTGHCHTTRSVAQDNRQANRDKPVRSRHENQRDIVADADPGIERTPCSSAEDDSAASGDG